MTRIAEIGSSSKIKLLKLNTANFETDETVEKLADILQLASFLKKCEIGYQLGNRKVKVAIEYASDEAVGSIVISDKATKQVICRRETNKTEANQKIEII